MAWLRHPWSLAGIALLLLVNLSWLWHGFERGSGFVIFCLLSALFVVLFVALCIRGLMHLIGGLSQDADRWVTGWMVFVLALVIAWPAGIFSAPKSLEDAGLIAQRKGMANCRTYLSMHPDGHAMQYATCFGFDRHQGDFELKNDTIFFRFGQDKRTSFALFEPSDDPLLHGELVYYRHVGDSLPVSFLITQLEDSFSHLTTTGHVLDR